MRNAIQGNDLKRKLTPGRPGVLYKIPKFTAKIGPISYIEPISSRELTAKNGHLIIYGSDI